MKQLQGRVLRELRAKYRGISNRTPPQWLARSRWNPTFCMSLPNDSRVLAIDLIPSANVPRAIYREEVRLLKDQHPHLRVIVCVLESGLESSNDTEAFCRKLGCGLQVFIAEVGLQTLITTDLDRSDSVEAATEPGWFPRCIVDEATNLKKLSFREPISEFCRAVLALSDDEKAVTKLVLAAVDTLLLDYPQCHANVGSFMKLAHFEAMFSQLKPNQTEHVLHSFRVFLVGCVVIDRFYKTFVDAHRRFCIGSLKKLSVEYCWLLTALFHDVGRPKEAAQTLLEAEFDDEDLAVIVTGKETRWLKEKYKNARRILASLGEFIAHSDDDAEWDGGAVTAGNALAAQWTDLHDRLRSHAVLSAFDMLSSIVEYASAVNEQKNRTFVVSHATPAALAILLHDWRIWPDARTWKLFPVDATMMPMAGLLIFIDTWDDFKRKGLVSPISVESFSVSDAGVNVKVRWMKAEEYAKEEVKYGAFKKALKRHRFPMRINVAVANA